MTNRGHKTILLKSQLKTQKLNIVIISLLGNLSVKSDSQNHAGFLKKPRTK
jgi:hypothetical protein